MKKHNRTYYILHWSQVMMKCSFRFCILFFFRLVWSRHVDGEIVTSWLSWVIHVSNGVFWVLKLALCFFIEQNPLIHIKCILILHSILIDFCVSLTAISLMYGRAVQWHHNPRANPWPGCETLIRLLYERWEQ